MGFFNILTSEKQSSEATNDQWADYASSIFGAPDIKANDTKNSAVVLIKAPERGIEPAIFYGVTAAFFVWILWKGKR